MTTFNLFAYGTLRDGGAADGMLAGCELLGHGVVRGMLYDIERRYPALVLYGDSPVHGAIWRCPADLLLKLDEYESTGRGLFRRVGLEAETGSGAVACWVYAAGPALASMLTADRRIDGGRWPAR